jgi:hypothetical protein
LSDPEQVLKRSKALLSKHQDGEIAEKIGKARQVVKRARELADERDRDVKGEELLKQLPQGEGSGLDADTVDGLHMSEIVEETKTSSEHVDKLEVEALELIIEHLKRVRGGE